MKRKIKVVRGYRQQFSGTAFLLACEEFAGVVDKRLLWCSPCSPLKTLFFVCAVDIFCAAPRYQKELAAYKAKKAAEGSEEEGSEEESD